MKILIIGGTGFIGGHLINELSGEHELYLFHRGQTPARNAGLATSVFGDRSRWYDNEESLRKIAPDLVLDLIPYTAEDAWNLMQTFRGITRRVIAISSADVYRAYEVFKDDLPELESLPLSEDSHLRKKLFPYRKSARGNSFDPLLYNYEKILVEQLYLTDPDFDTTVLRLPALYGEGDSQYKLSEYIQPMLDKRPFLLMDAKKANWCWTRGYIKNIAKAISRIIEAEAPDRDIYNLGEAVSLPESEWVEWIRSLLNWKGEVLLLPSKDLPEHLKPPFNFDQSLVIDSTRFREEFEAVPAYDRSTSLRRTLDYHRTHPAWDGKERRRRYKLEDQALSAI